MIKTISAFALMGLAGIALAGAADTTFEKLDVDKDSSLTPTEYAAAKSEHSFESLDRNSDGKLDSVEFSVSKDDGSAKK
jgi:hypothetical protein